ncbi:5-hydroxytryptamine receptor 1B-like [Protopterus annectens]|uniref:5-hydroxytryptamine receptor 1B-like n=1 Tax=Protopterus annectens TaxID=7888 RepID=UPI001CFAD77F|nr:5-hydroxytryptamine receptor 1B-like [Protopterus annectens]
MIHSTALALLNTSGSSAAVLLPHNLQSEMKDFDVIENNMGLGPIWKGILGFIMIAMCITATTGNLLVIITVAATKQFRCITSIFLVNLAVSDLLVGAGVMPLVALEVIYNKLSKHQHVCIYMGYALLVYCTSSVLTLAAIALDRYHAIIDCFQYNTQVTVRRTITTVIWIWIQAVTLALPPFFGWGHFEYQPTTFCCSADWSHSPTYTVFIMTCSFLLPTCVTIFCYVRIVKVARDHARRIHDIESHLQKSLRSKVIFSKPENQAFIKVDNHASKKVLSHLHTEDSQSSTDTSQQQRQLSVTPCQRRKQDIFALYSFQGRELHAPFRLLLLIVIFFCCWMPHIVISISQAAQTKHGRNTIHSQVSLISAWLSLLNSAINPLIYALLSKRFRKALRKIRQKIYAKLQALIQNDGNILSSLESGISKKKKPNVLGVHSDVSVLDQLHLHTYSMFSIASFAETGPADDKEECLPLHFAGFSTPCIRVSQANDVTATTIEDELVLKTDSLGKKYIELPTLPFEPTSSFQLGNVKSSTFVFGKITVKVNNNS